MNLKKAFTGLLFIGWTAFGMAMLRMDFAIAGGNSLYVPELSIPFEVVMFCLLIMGSAGVLVFD